MRSRNDWIDYLEHRLMMSSYLMHYNHNHDALGRFSSGIEGGSSSPTRISKLARQKEPKITSDVSTSVKGSGGKLYGLKNVLKTEDSIARKSKTKEVNDAVRYTALLSQNDFVKQYKSINANLNKKGYEQVKCKNYFKDYKEGKVNHKAVQTNYKTNDGYVFEIQFHTKASQKAKDKKVPLYEESRNPKTSSKRRSELDRQMRVLADNIVDPPGIEKIKER